MRKTNFIFLKEIVIENFLFFKPPWANEIEKYIHFLVRCSAMFEELLDLFHDLYKGITEFRKVLEKYHDLFFPRSLTVLQHSVHVKMMNHVINLYELLRICFTMIANNHKLSRKIGNNIFELWGFRVSPGEKQ